MKRILLVDDDEVIRKLYADGLALRGFAVTAASDGLAAIRALNTEKPDLVVLDLMMPRLNGIEVLKYLRASPSGVDIPVLVLSNSYMDDLSRQAAQFRPEAALLKARCTPALLGDAVERILQGQIAAMDPSALLAAELLTESVAKETESKEQAAVQRRGPAASEIEHSPKFEQIARRNFLLTGAKDCPEYYALLDSIATAASERERKARLEILYRKFHFLTASAGMAGFHDLAHLAAAVEALVFGNLDRPSAVTPSLLETVAQAVRLIQLLFERGDQIQATDERQLDVLVVDDDPLTDRVVVSALRQAGCHARSELDPMAALQLARERRFDLVLLDIMMPRMDGFELRRLLREMPGYQQVPAIYMTSYEQYECHAITIRTEGDDLITKPLVPLELAVKGVMLLLQRQIDTHEYRN